MLENIRGDSRGSIPPLCMPSLLPHDLCHEWNVSRRLPGLPNTYTKIISKLIKDLNVRPETIKLLEENIRTLSDINHSEILYDSLPTVMEIKTKISKWDLIKLKSFGTMKEIISKVKRQLSEWEKIIAN